MMKNIEFLEMQTLFDIAMSIGNSLDMDTMLKECIPVYLCQLNFSGGAVFEMKPASYGWYRFDAIYSLPTGLVVSDDCRKAVNAIPDQIDAVSVQSFFDRLPIFESCASTGSSYIMRLASFGLLLLSGGDAELRRSELKDLISINRKLAQACLACKRNESIKKDAELRRRSEKEAIENKERSKKIFNSVQSGMVIVDETNHRIVDANAQAIRIFQVGSIDDVVGRQRHHFILPAASKDCSVSSRWSRGSNNTERLVITQYGDMIPVLKTSTRISLDGRPHLLESFIDIRKQKTAEIERIRAEEKLNRLQRLDALGILAGGIAHDFNNILSSINGYTELALLDVEKHSPLENHLKAVHMASQRAKKLVGQILTFARQTEDALQPVRVSAIAKEAVTLLRPSVPTGIKINTHIESNALIMSDPTKIHQIIVNLCDNGLHAMGKRGILEIRLSETDLDDDLAMNHPDVQPGRFLVLQVKDTGAGIAPDMIESIFEPYFTTKQAGEGTGLGLSVVHSIVTGYGGAIFVSSTPGEGSVFSVYLPVANEFEVQKVFPNEQLPRGSERILLVDDEEDITNVGSQLLGRLGYRVTPKNDSMDALRLFSKNPHDFDLVITDLVMPRMTGDELSTRMRKIRHDTPIILCTGYSKHVTGENVSKIGIEAFALKPLNKQDLALIVREVLDKAKL